MNKGFVGRPFCKKVSPHPFQKLSHNKSLNRVVNLLIDSRRERNARFGYREIAGATETLLSKKVVENKTERGSRNFRVFV